MASPLREACGGLGGGGICSATDAAEHMADARAGEMSLHPSATQLTSPGLGPLRLALRQVPTAEEIDGTAGTRQWRRWR